MVSLQGLRSGVLLFVALTSVARSTFAQGVPAAAAPLPSAAPSAPVATASAAPAEANANANANASANAAPRALEVSRDEATMRDVTVRAVSAEQLRRIRQRCNETNGVDWFAWISGAGLIALGASLAAWQLSVPPPERTSAGWYTVGIGPGLVLGGIGVPFGRGILRGMDPLATACRDVLRPHADGSAPDALDAEMATRLLRASAQPTSVVLLVLLSAATAAVAGGAIAAIVTHNNELAQMTGGFSAAAVAGWFIVPPTPVHIAATRFVDESARARASESGPSGSSGASALDGWGLTIGASF